MVVPCCTTWFIGGLLTNCGNHLKIPYQDSGVMPNSAHFWSWRRPAQKQSLNHSNTIRLSSKNRRYLFFRHCYRIEEDMVKINLTDWFKCFFEFLYILHDLTTENLMQILFSMVLEAYIHGAIKSWAFEKDISFTKHGDHFRDFPTSNGTILEALLLIGLIYQARLGEPKLSKAFFQRQEHLLPAWRQKILRGATTEV